MEDFTKSRATVEAYALEDNRVITGQNPASGGLVAELVLKQLQNNMYKSRFSSIKGDLLLRNHLQNSNNFFSISESSIASIYSGLKS